MCRLKRTCALELSIQKKTPLAPNQCSKAEELSLRSRHSFNSSTGISPSLSHPYLLTANGAQRYPDKGPPFHIPIPAHVTSQQATAFHSAHIQAALEPLVLHPWLQQTSHKHLLYTDVSLSMSLVLNTGMSWLPRVSLTQGTSKVI